MSADGHSNRRQERRRQVRIASILTSDGRSPISCVVLDLSRGGARIHVHDPSEVPDQFRLLLLANNEEHGSIAVWRTNDEIGVKFTD